MTESTDLRLALHSAAVTVGYAVVFGASLIGASLFGTGGHRADGGVILCGIVGIVSGLIFYKRASLEAKYAG